MNASFTTVFETIRVDILIVRQVDKYETVKDEN